VPLSGRLLRCFAGLILVAHPLAGEARSLRLTRTDFGYLHLAPRHVDRASEIGGTVQRMAREILGIAAVRFLIVDGRHSKWRWGDTMSRGLPVYPWRFANGAVPAGQPPDDILAHEIGHDLFRRYVVPSTRPGQYGTDAPDWLDESVAIAFEDSEQKAERRCEAFRHLKSGTLIPIDQYLTMEHPDLAATPVDAGKSRDFSSAPTVSALTPVFYAMSLAFFEYLVDRTGSISILGEIGRIAKKGEAPDRWIKTRIAGKHSEDSAAILNQDFVTWLSTDARYRCFDPSATRRDMTPTEGS
jgi:hypothetical protein